MEIVRSGSRSAVTSALIARFIKLGIANRPMPATASARVAAAKKVRDLRRLRSVIDLRSSEVTISASSCRDDGAVADRDDPVGALGQLEIVRDVQDRLALPVQPLEQLEHLRRGHGVQVAGRLV